MQTYKERAKTTIGTYCKVCRVCNGVACRGVIPGPGGKGTGAGFVRNYDDLRRLTLNMDTLHDVTKADTSTTVFGEQVSAPIFAGPIGAVQLHYSDLYSDYTYSKALLEGCAEAGTLAFTGDGVQDEVFVSTGEAIAELEGRGVPTIKPWEPALIEAKMRIAERAGAKAVAMDIDAAGLPILAGKEKRVSPKSPEVLKAVIKTCEKPVVLKGIMTRAGALKAIEAGAYGIVVSNHGGRVLDETPSTISVLEEIVDAVEGRLKVFIDGGFRSGLDVFKALALGADGVIIARPFVTAVYGGGKAAVADLMAQYQSELASAMVMTGCAEIADIKASHVRWV